jgi:Uma2 family endonuclease
VHPDEVTGEWLDMTRLLLVAEVVSPSSSRADRVVKRRAYQRHGVETYWVVDADAGLAEV